MKDMKLKPMIITFIIVVLLLAAGTFAYQYVTQQKPLQEQLAGLQYSQISTPIKKQDGKYNLTLQIENDYSLQQAIHEVTEVMNSHKLSEEQYALQLTNNNDASSELQVELEVIWQGQLFSIAEIMANGQYSKLPDLMQMIEQQYDGVKASAEMDEQHVYITLRKNSERLDKMLPIDSGVMEVWQNAKS